MWPTIRASFPDATLDIAYGWDLFIKGYANNPERMAWMDRLNEQMKQPGITHHGRLGKQELWGFRSQCGIWTYPTDFFEINCITALESQADGLVPVTMDYGALQETVQSGVRVKGDIYDEEAQAEYLKELLSMMGDEKRWLEESEKAKKFARAYVWDTIAKTWIQHFT